VLMYIYDGQYCTHTKTQGYVLTITNITKDISFVSQDIYFLIFELNSKC